MALTRKQVENSQELIGRRDVSDICATLLEAGKVIEAMPCNCDRHRRTGMLISACTRCKWLVIWEGE